MQRHLFPVEPVTDRGLSLAKLIPAPNGQQERAIAARHSRAQSCKRLLPRIFKRERRYAKQLKKTGSCLRRGNASDLQLTLGPRDTAYSTQPPLRIKTRRQFVWKRDQETLPYLPGPSSLARSTRLANPPTLSPPRPLFPQHLRIFTPSTIRRAGDPFPRPTRYALLLSTSPFGHDSNHEGIF